MRHEASRGQITHRMDGRVRVKIPGRRRDLDWFHHLYRHLSAHPQVAEVRTDPLTASVLIRHHGDFDAIAKFADDESLFWLPAIEAVERPLVEELTRRAKDFDVWLRSKSHGKLDIGSLAVLVFLGGGVVQLARGQISAPASSLFWYAARAVTLAAGRRRDVVSEHGRV